MNLPICVKCRQRISAFNVRLEHIHEDVGDGALDYDWARVFCLTCGSEVWFDELEAISLNDLDKAIRRLNNDTLGR